MVSSLFLPEKSRSSLSDVWIVSLFLTVVSHHVFQGVKVGHFGLVSAEDFSSGTKIVWEIVSVSVPHHAVTAEVVDLSVERYVVGGPVTYQAEAGRGVFLQTTAGYSRGTDETLPLRRVRVWSEYTTLPGICSTTVRAPFLMLRRRETLLKSTTMYWLLYVPKTDMVSLLIPFTVQTSCVQKDWEKKKTQINFWQQSEKRKVQRWKMGFCFYDF